MNWKRYSSSNLCPLAVARQTPAGGRESRSLMWSAAALWSRRLWGTPPTTPGYAELVQTLLFHPAPACDTSKSKDVVVNSVIICPLQRISVYKNLHLPLSPLTFTFLPSKSNLKMQSAVSLRLNGWDHQLNFWFFLFVFCLIKTTSNQREVCTMVSEADFIPRELN